MSLMVSLKTEKEMTQLLNYETPGWEYWYTPEDYDPYGDLSAYYEAYPELAEAEYYEAYPELAEYDDTLAAYEEIIAAYEEAIAAYEDMLAEYEGALAEYSAYDPAEYYGY
jgi:hypothetical protein